MKIFKKKIEDTILVTGGAGFIGSALIRAIINDTEYNVINLDKLTYAGNLDSLSSIETSTRYSFQKIDICDQDSITRILQEFKPTFIMHLAAESHVDRSIDAPSNFINTNINGTYVMLEEARKYFSNLDQKEKEKFRFHHISTDEVYGDLVGKDDLFTEASSYSPSSSGS